MATTAKTGSRSIRKVSNAELARFLHHLSTLYRDDKTGNVGLSMALEDLARSLTQTRNVAGKSKGATESSVSEALKNADFETLNNLLDDDGLTKNDLIRVAIERFGVPKSKLARLNRDGVKSELKSAMLHEESLKIISQEAKRGGANRVS